MWNFSPFLSNSTSSFIVSRKDIFCSFLSISNLFSLCSLSAEISKCSSPMPPIFICLVSSSTQYLKLGSWICRFFKASHTLFWSWFLLGSIAWEITGSAKLIKGLFLSQNVSPVTVFFKPTIAAMSPAPTSLIFSLLLACILTKRLTVSTSCLLTL